MPESFKVLIKELQSIGLDIKVLAEDAQEIEIHDDDDDIDERAHALELDNTEVEAGDGQPPQDGGEPDSYDDGDENHDDEMSDEDIIANIGNMEPVESLDQVLMDRKDEDFDDYDGDID